MGGRGGIGHYPGMYGRNPNFMGYYVPRTLQEALGTHMRMQSFSQALWDTVPSAERDAIRAYTGSDYVSMNDALFGKNQASSYTQNLIDLATRGMDRFEAKFDFVSVRGDRPSDMASLLQGTVAQLSNPAFLRSRIGKEFEFKGFMSSAVHEDAAWTWKGVTTVIKTPKGTKGLFVDPVSRHRGESEFMYQRGTKLKVLKIETDSRGQLKKIYLEAVQKKKH